MAGRGMRAFFWLFGVLNVANGLWMLLGPAAWYRELPAAVPDTGPLNLHFVRDIGSAFLTLGVMFLVAAPRAAWRREVVVAAAMFYGLHALVHVTDLTSGRLGADHWLIDLPGVFLPAVVLVVLCLPRWWVGPDRAVAKGVSR
jgi:Domain of unknown function (DUF4345)